MSSIWSTWDFLTKRLKHKKQIFVPVLIMAAYRGKRSTAPLILNLGTRWKYVVNFTIQPLYPPGISHRSHWMGGWVGLTAGLSDLEKKRKISCPCLYSKSESYIILTTLSLLFVCVHICTWSRRPVQHMTPLVLPPNSTFFLKDNNYACYTIQLMHYSHFKKQSLQHLKPIKY